MVATQRRILLTVHKDCIVCTVLWQKAPLGIKQTNQTHSISHCQGNTLASARASVSQPVKFCSSVLKACLGLVLPNQEKLQLIFR